MVGCAEFAKKLTLKSTNKNKRKLSAVERVLSNTDDKEDSRQYNDPWASTKQRQEQGLKKTD